MRTWLPPLCVACLCNPAWALDPTLTLPGKDSLKTIPKLESPIVVAKPKPLISAIIASDATKGCFTTGDSLTVKGSTLGTDKLYGLVLSGNGVHLDLSTSSWRSDTIRAQLPNDSRLKSGLGYSIALESHDHSKMLSNNKNITLCAAANIKPLSAATSALSSTALDTAAAVDATGASSAGTGTTTPNLMLPAGGGSLLSGALPAPPQDLPSLPARDDDSIEAGEVLIISPSMASAQKLGQQARTMGFGILRRTQLKSLDLVVSVLRTPKGMTVSQAIATLRQQWPEAWIDANHRYRLQGETNKKRYGPPLIRWGPSPARCGRGLRLGMIDTAIDTRHPALTQQRLHTRSFLSAGIHPAAMDHGTAVAALLLGRVDQGDLVGLLPGADLYAATVFRQRGKRHTDTTAEWVAAALDWLAQKQVSVINLSLGGPRNLLIEASIARLLQQEIAIVAAAGNGGRKAAPVYPAAQSGVLAVSAVDARGKPYRKANRGDYIDFVAPGVDLWTARTGGSGAYVSGTSYASPFVAAAMALAKKPNTKLSHTKALKTLQKKVRDLGAAGHDPVFGWGLIQSVAHCSER